MEVFNVPHVKLELPLIKLREYLISIGYPLASNEELNVPDSVIRLREGLHITNIEPHETYNTYTIKEVSYNDC